MDEDAHNRFRHELPDHLWHKQQMVIMYPYKVSWLIDVNDAFRKGKVGLFVGRPMLIGGSVFGCNVLPEEIVEKRP